MTLQKTALYIFLLLLSSLTRATENNQPNATAARCLSYEKAGNRVVFTCDNGSKLSIDVCSEAVLKVWFAPDGQFVRNNESFAVVNEQLGEPIDLRVEDQPACYEFYTAQLRVRINKSPMQLQIYDKYQKLLFSDFKERGHIHEPDGRTIAYKSLRPDEHLFGLGEKTGAMDRRGGHYKMWNSDKPCYSTTEDPLYKSIPFFLSNYRYGIFFDNTYKTEFRFGTESNDYYSFEAPAGPFIYYFMFGQDYKELLGHYMQLTGQPIMPPKWAFGFAQCRGLLTNEKLSREIAAGYRERGIPCDIIYQDIGWTEGLQNFVWRPGNYENPKQMLSDLADQGFKVIVSQDPVISQATKQQWEEADSLGYLVKDSTTGKSYDMPWPWGGNCGVVDFTLPAVADWWGSYQQRPIDDGIKGFWTDMGEPAWSNEEQVERLVMQHHLGMHDEIHNVYGLTWDRVVKEQFEKRNPNQRLFQMTRAAYAGLQRYTFGWTGDSGNSSDVTQGWGQLANQIPTILSAGLGGIPFITTDITGYCGDIRDHAAMSELFIRWMQFGIFNPLSRLHHEGNNAVEPWLFGEEAEAIAKAAIEWKYRHLPYMYSYAREAYETGLPILRPLFLEYPMDNTTFGLDHQFLFGEELLVAPVVKRGADTQRLYLPEGTWIDYNDKKTIYAGEEWYTVEAPLETTPLFVRRGSIIPTMPVMQYVGEKSVYPVIFEVFPAAKGNTCSFVFYEDEGEDLGYQREEYAKTAVTLTTRAAEMELLVAKRQANGYQPPMPRHLLFRIYLKESPKQVTMGGKKVKATKSQRLLSALDNPSASPSWCWDKEQGVCLISLPDSGEQQTVILQ